MKKFNLMIMKHIKKRIKYIYVYIQALLLLIINNKYSHLYFVGFFAVWIVLIICNCIMELNTNPSESILNNTLFNNINEVECVKDIYDKNNSLNNQYKNTNNNYILNFNSNKINSRHPLEIWTNHILCKDKSYFPSYFQNDFFIKKSSVLNNIPLHINWNIEKNILLNENTTEFNIADKTIIKGKVTLTELKQIQGIENDKFILSTKEQYELIEEKLQGFILEREKKISIINDIKNGTELWYPLNSGEQMQKTISEIIDPAINNLSEMKNNILKEIKNNQ